MSKNNEKVKNILGKSIYKEGFSLNKLYVTQVGLALMLKLPSGSWQYDTYEALKKIALDLRDMAIQSDFLMPLLVGIENVDSGEGEKIKQLQSNQDWHRGKFLLTPRSEKEIKDLLQPEALDLKKYEPKAKDIDDFLKKFKKKGVSDNLHSLINSFTSELSKADLNLNKLQEIWEEGLEEVWWKQRKSAEEFLKKLKPGTDETLSMQDQKSKTRNHIKKIKQVTIENFRGIKKLNVNTDGNIILISGPNGSGKSSFVEALTLGLTGYHPKIKDNRYPDHFFFYGADNFEIILNNDIRCEANKNTSYSESIRNNISKIKRKVSEEILQREIEKGSPELLYRLTTFLPEFVEQLFDDASRSLSLVELFEPIPFTIKSLKQAIENKNGIEDKIEERIEDIKKEESDLEVYTDRLSEEIPNFFEKLLDNINICLDKIGRSGLKLNFMKDLNSNEDIFRFLKNMEELLRPIVSTGLEKWKEFLETIYEKIKKDIRQKHEKYYKIREMIEKIEKEIKMKEDELKEPQQRKTIVLEKTRDNIALKDIFNALSDSNILKKWKKALKDEGLEDIYQELKRIIPEKSKNCAESLKRWCEEIDKRKGALEKQKEELNSKLEQYKKQLESISLPQDVEEALRKLEKAKDNEIITKIDDFLELYKTKGERKSEIEDLETKNKEIKKLKSIIEEWQKPSDPLKQGFEGAINNVLKRFAMTEGLEEVKLVVPEQEENRYFIIQAKEKDNKETKRGKEHFSLGQRAQIATAWMIAQRELAHACKDVEIPHRVIILDDPTATFDMTNLLSQAILLRQLAYHPDEERRYQLFIVSHHEEFTSRLLDLLCPPQGCSMKLIRFVKWTPDNGAETEAFEVENAPEKLEYSKEALKEGIETYGELS